MAIVLVTGLPGHGKTLYALQRVQNEALKDGRAVFYSGIRDLALPWQQWDPERWQELEPGSIMVIDECQSVFPVRGRGQPPDWIEELAKHRHLGVDFYVITQNPMLMDAFVRRLCDRHFHVVRKFGTQFATVHEFTNGVRENCATSREGGIRHEWRYPREVFGWYKSAELHTVKRRVPARVWFLVAAPILFAVFAGVAYNRMVPDSDASGEAAQASSLAASAPRADPVGRRGAQAAAEPRDYLADFVPRVPGLDYTAPAYDEVTKPAQAPYPAACVAMGPRCVCYTQQGTRLQTPDQLCRGIVAGGFFVAWEGRADLAPRAQTAELRAAEPGPSFGILDTRPRPVAVAASAPR